MLPVVPGSYHLQNYEEACRRFDWQDVEKEFSWFSSGKVNMAHECIDRHADSHRKDKLAFIFHDDFRTVKYSYADFRKVTNQAANMLQSFGVGKGDRVFLFMPRSPELYIAAMGAIKLGAIIGPLFEAFMESAIKDRLLDSGAKAVVTVSELADRIPVDQLPDLESIFVVGDSKAISEKQIYFNQEMKKASSDFDVVWVDRHDGMLIHYTSGSTGKPKGVLHAHNAMIQHLQTGKWVLDLREDDIYWCTADPGWVSGTSYGMFAPWLLGATSLVLGGRFNPDKWYHALEAFHVTIWYSAPTAFRMLMGADQAMLKTRDLSALRHILSVGEPLNPEVIKWGMETYGLRIHDTWWMTETGAHMICNYPCMDIRPGSMGKPIPGIEAAIVDDAGQELPAGTLGNLAIRKGWPSMMKAIWQDEEKYNSYFINDTWYVTGDSAHMDEDGYFWFHGRVDDVILTAGERVGPFEIESTLLEHPAVAEAGAIGKPDSLRGQIIKVFIALNTGYEPSDELKKSIVAYVRTKLAAHAYPRELEFVDRVPKTRSGKVMRRVLKAIELGLPVGDLSTLETE